MLVGEAVAVEQVGALQALDGAVRAGRHAGEQVGRHAIAGKARERVGQGARLDGREAAAGEGEDVEAIAREQIEKVAVAGELGIGGALARARRGAAGSSATAGLGG